MAPPQKPDPAQQADLDVRAYAALADEILTQANAPAGTAGAQANLSGLELPDEFKQKLKEFGKDALTLVVKLLLARFGV